jgi:hypothetical protein
MFTAHGGSQQRPQRPRLHASGAVSVHRLHLVGIDQTRHGGHDGAMWGLEPMKMPRGHEQDLASFCCNTHTCRDMLEQDATS